jgi:peptidoglycan/LPS O-acetylase OafA/YrhL
MTTIAWLAALAAVLMGAGLGRITRAKWPQRRRERAFAFLALPPALYVAFLLMGGGWPKDSTDWAWVGVGAMMLSPFVLALWTGVLAEKLYRKARQPAAPDRED